MLLLLLDRPAEASHEIVTACFSEFYVGVDSNMRNLQVDFQCVDERADVLCRVALLAAR